MKSMITLFLTFGFSIMGTNTFANDAIDQYFRAYTGNVPGASVLIVKDGQIEYAKGYGLQNYEERIESTPQTNYRLASVSKAFTAMAIMQLKERGQLSYDSTLTELIADFPEYGSRITVRMLLGHTSGLRDYESHIPGNQRDQLKDSDVVDILKGLRSTYFTPGTQYRYSNSGYATLAHIVEIVSGQRFSTFLKENIFDVIDMTESVAYEKDINEVSHRAYGYTRTNSGYRRTDQSITSAVLGDGGVYTSATDYIKWDNALYGEDLVTAETLAEAFTSGTTTSGNRTGYGFGWKLDTWRGKRRISHTGSTIGFRTAVQRFPDQKLTVLVMINRANTAPWSIAEQIADHYL